MKTSFAFVALAVALCAPPAQAVIVIAFDGNARLNSDAPTQLGTINGDGDPNIVTGTVPTQTRYSVFMYLRDTENTDPNATIPITSITFAGATIGNSNTATTASLNYNTLKFFAEGSGAPVVSLYDSSHADLTVPVYGQNVVGTSLPANTKYVAFGDQRVSATAGGGQLVPNSQGETQFINWAFTVTYANGTVTSPGFQESVMFSTVPEPGSLSLLGIVAIGALRLRRRRP